MKLLFDMESYMNQNNMLHKKMLFTIALFSAQDVSAANFNIVPIGTLPTSVVQGQTVAANFTITNMTNSARNGYSIVGLPATVSQNTSSPNCTNPIHLAAKASCNLKLDIAGAVSSGFAICNGINCTQAETLLNVSVSNAPSAPQFAYITNLNQDAPYVSLCPLNATTGAIESCSDAGGDDVLGAASGLAGIALNNSGSVAYMTAESGNSVFQCTINPSTKEFDVCTSTDITSPSYNAAQGQLALNHDETIAYIVDSTNNGDVLACQITSGFIVNNCVNTNASGGFSGLYQIALNQNDSVAYLGASYDGVLKCNVNGTTFSNCNLITGDGNITFTNSMGVALNNDGTKLYVAEDYNSVKKVYVCSTTMNGDNFSHCDVAYDQFSQALWSITLNASNTVAYISNDSATENSNTYTCAISAIDGKFSSCESSTFAPTPTSTALRY